MLNSSVLACSFWSQGEKVCSGLTERGGGSVVNSSGINSYVVEPSKEGVGNETFANLPPCSISISCPVNQTVLADAVCQYSLLDYSGLITSSASCGIASLIQYPAAGTLVGAGISPVKFVLTDNNGNKDSCSFDVIVRAAVNPTIVNCGTVLIGETTVGKGNTENNFSCVGFATPGEDVYYQVTVPSNNYRLQISISNVVDANDSGLETFWVGGACPVGGGCLSSESYNIATQQFSVGGGSVQYLAVGPGIYYFVVDAQNDGIDSYDIRFDCLDSGIEFDESIACGNPDNNGIVPSVNGTTVLNIETCTRDTICHDLYIANEKDVEWIDSVYMDLGMCFVNVVPTAVAGFYQTGMWNGVYDGVNNSIAWSFNNTNNAAWGDGMGGSYSCDNSSTRKHTLCFTADISLICVTNSDLDIGLFIADDAVGSGGATVAGIDYVLSDQFVVNNPSPVIVCHIDTTVNNDIGSCSAIVNGLTPVLGDNCPDPFATYVLSGATIGSGVDDASGSSFNVGVTIVKYIVSDSLGLKDSCSFTVTVTDNEPPSITCLNNQIEYACSFVLPAYPPLTHSDNCTASPSIVITQNPVAGSLILNDTLVTLYAADGSGNVDSCSFMLLLKDTISPTIICAGNISVANDIGMCGAIVNAIAPIVNDNCGIDSVNYVLSGATMGAGLADASGLMFNRGVTIITYTVTDLSNNVASCSFTVLVVDNEPPTITCFANITVSNDAGGCGAIVGGLAPVANDNCAIDSVSYVLSGVTIGSGLADASGLTFNVGLTTVLYTVLDSSGNINSCSATVLVVDNEVPSFACPPNKNEYLTSACSFSIPNYTDSIVGLADNCTPNSSIVLTQNPTVGTLLVGHNTMQQIKLYAQDTFGNIDSCAFTITLKDTIKPTIVCPGNITAYAGNNCDYVIPNYSPSTVFDNCASVFSLLLTQYPNVGSVINTDTTLVLSANDGNGNVNSCSFQITLLDTISPSIICPNDTVINNDVGDCGATVVLGAPLVVDNCLITSLLNDVNNSGNASDYYPEGITTVTWTVVDGSSNNSTCSYDVEIVDVEPPVINCVNDTIINTDNNSCDAIFNFTNTGTDNCSYVINQIAGLPSGSIFPAGITLNRFVATDPSGLTDTCSFVVTVVDSQSPTIICSNGIVICDSNVALALPIVADNCMIATVTNDYNLSNDASSIYPIGITVVNWTVTDTSGNSSTCTTVVEVEEKPSIANAGTDQNLVLNQNTYLEANTPLVGAGVWSLISGNGDIDNNIDPSSFLSGLIMGDNILVWTITNGSCPVAYDEVTIIVGGLKIPSGFSPNGDGNNDAFVIPGIETVASEINIFNRWGVEVYNAVNYQNDWEGISDDGKTLPDDTYFYTVKLPGYAEEYNGYVVIKR